MRIKPIKIIYEKISVGWIGTQAKHTSMYIFKCRCYTFDAIEIKRCMAMIFF